MVRERADKVEYTFVTVTARNHTEAQPVIDKFLKGEKEFLSRRPDSNVSAGAFLEEPARLKLTDQWTQLGPTMIESELEQTMMSTSAE